MLFWLFFLGIFHPRWGLWTHQTHGFWYVFRSTTHAVDTPRSGDFRHLGDDLFMPNIPQKQPKVFGGKFSHSWYHKMGCWILGWARRIMRVKHQNSTGMIEGVWFSILMVQIYLGKLYRPHCDLTGIMVSKEHHPQMAELFRLVKYFHLPRFIGNLMVALL